MIFPDTFQPEKICIIQHEKPKMFLNKYYKITTRMLQVYLGILILYYLK